jgi:hypothetical protein
LAVLAVLLASVVRYLALEHFPYLVVLAVLVRLAR